MNAVIKFLADNGLTTTDENFYSYIDMWLDWYTSQDTKFHKRNHFNGIQVVTKEIYQLGMAKTVCEDWASVLMNEKVDISLNDEEQQKILDEVFRMNRFKVNANRLIEIAFALGTGAFVEYLNHGEVWIDYIRADNIFPISWNSKGIYECAFSSNIHQDGKDLINLQIHLKDDSGIYHILNRRLEVSNDENIYKELDIPSDVDFDFNTGSDTPLFQIVMPNIINTIDLDSPMGLSVFSGALDVLKVIDNVFDSFNVEMETGRRMVFLSAEMFNTDKDGNLRNVIGEHDTILRWVGSMEDGQQVSDYTPDLRFTEIREALQFQLNLLSEKVGMGTNRYTFTGSGVKTATEVISEDSDLYQTMRKHEILLEDSLKGLIEAIRVLLSKIGVTISTENLSIDFDDSIITDKNSDRQQYQLEVASGLMRPEMYRMLIYGEDEETAKKNLGDAFGETRSEEVIL